MEYSSRRNNNYQNLYGLNVRLLSMEMEQRHGSMQHHTQPREFFSSFQDLDSSPTRSYGFDDEK